MPMKQPSIFCFCGWPEPAGWLSGQQSCVEATVEVPPTCMAQAGEASADATPLAAKAKAVSKVNASRRMRR